ncbi:homocysteine S-methyltransferase family protein [Maridesulfovibrio hydrothermalis]|uniref:Methionine synthase n=1 Tax=Maridesulfovibrio hydrothermalis AM13 = DSM 14728 TaxID=1121451 RepID=L0RC92_9BACT|nr:homocysteine S-methyltransferase family protein [Maridesulfovibrio hydrothermalis]CCO23181.1 Homocysteine S-methyltransferase [Maridesulfovibrio hydrothermalis AM13 = DSM 14728]
MPDFRKALGDGRVYFFDGGYGTFLQSRGLPAGMSPEIFGLESPEVIRSVHQDYVDAGANVLTTNTFGGSRPKLGADVDVSGLNREMALIARSVAGDKVFVGGSVGPTGHFVQPLGEMTFKELVEIFKEQVQGLVEGGVDLILGETHFDLAEARALVIATREVCDLPVAVSMTFESPAACLTGTSPLTFIDTMQNMGVELMGTNCSAGPEQIFEVLKNMQPRLSSPLLVEANAGLPELDENRNTVFRLQPQPFAEQSARFLEVGAKFIGGCCGTGPDHIRALRKAVGDATWKKPVPQDDCQVVLTSRGQSVAIGFEQRGVIIGERINPTGKKVLIEELQKGQFTEAMKFAQEQITAGAPVLDVNVGAAMVDEVKTLPALTKEIFAQHSAPLSLDSTNPDAIEAALWEYPGSPLVNSISGEPGRMERLGPLCKKFGAPFILLPIIGSKLPFTCEEKVEVVSRLLKQADDLGIPRRLIMVDALALTVSSKPVSARHCLDFIRYCREEWNLPCVLGLSNISFGLPARELLNSTFLTLCQGQGMAAFIANPNSTRLREALYSAEVLLARDPQAEQYIDKFADWTPSGDGGAGGGGGTKEKDKTGAENLFDAVVKGERGSILDLVERDLEGGREPFALVNEDLIPAIMEVGEKYERKEYFLPQLLQSAETLQKAFGRLKPLLEAAGGTKEQDTIVMATVEGDIHDIGKNIVCLMLRNHGFNVIDLGKDVSAEAVVDAAQENGAKIIGLSALMTTTMVKMEDTINLIKERGLDIKVMIGGAVITGGFSESIGADGWSTDAVSAVKIAKELLQ